MLRESEERLYRILDALPGAISWKDRDGRYLGCNSAFAHAVGLEEPRSIAGLTDEDLPRPLEGGEGAKSSDQAVLDGQATRYDAFATASGPDEPDRWVKVSKAPIEEADGRISGVLGSFEDVTDRRRTEEALRASEEMFSSVFRLSPEVISLTRVSDGKIVLCNERFEERFGFPANEAVGRTTVELNLWPSPIERSLFLGEVRERGEVVNKEISLRRKDGDLRTFLYSSRFLDISGESFMLSVGRDITDRKSAEDNLRLKIDEIERFNRLAVGREARLLELKREINRLSEALGRPAVYNLTDASSDFTGTEPQPGEAPPIQAPESSTSEPDAFSSVSHLAEIVDMPRLQKLMDSFCEAVGIAAAIVDLDGRILIASRWQSICTDFHRLCSVSQERCRESDTVLSRQMREGEDFSLYACRNGLTDAASPVIVEGRHIANVFVGQFLLEPPDLDFFRRQALEIGADEAAYMEALRNVPVVERERLPAILSFLAGMAHLIGQSGMERNRALAAEAEQARQARALADSVEELQHHRQVAISLAEDAMEARRVTEDARAALQDEKGFSDAVVNGLPGIFALCDFDGRLVRWNRNLEQVIGADAGGLGSQSLLQILPEDDHQATEAHFRRVLETGSSQWEARLLAPNGRLIPYLFTGLRLRTGGRDYIVGIGIDIRDRKRMEEELRESRERYRELVQSTNSIVLRWDREGTVLFMNEFALTFFGYSAAEIVGRNVVGTIVPDSESSGRDLVKLVEQVRLHPEMYEANVNENLRHDGSRVWIAWSNTPVNGPDGELAEILSVGVDMTERKRAEDALQKSEERYRTMVETAQEGIWVLDRSYRTTYVNNRTSAMLGYTIDEMISRPIWDFVDEAARSRLRADIENWLNGTGIHELCLRQRDGAELWAIVSVSPTRDEANRYSGFYAMLTDITERKKVEEHKREFYRETISSVTDGKLLIVGHDETAVYLYNAELMLDLHTLPDLPATRHKILDYCREIGISGETTTLFDIACGEAMTNAVKHGSGGCAFSGHREDMVWVGVSDTGSGISTLTLPHATLHRGFSTKVSLGLGYSIMLEAADRILLSTGPEGTTVVLFKSVHPESAELDLIESPASLHGFGLV